MHRQRKCNGHVKHCETSWFCFADTPPCNTHLLDFVMCVCSRRMLLLCAVLFVVLPHPSVSLVADELPCLGSLGPAPGCGVWLQHLSCDANIVCCASGEADVWYNHTVVRLKKCLYFSIRNPLLSLHWACRSSLSFDMKRYICRPVEHPDIGCQYRQKTCVTAMM